MGDERSFDALDVRVLDAGDRDAWRGLLDRVPADVYFLPEYHRACEGRGGEALLFVAERYGDAFLYPFVLRPIELGEERVEEERRYDVDGACGYAGPLATTQERGFLSDAWAAFGDWCRERRVVAEVVRFNPLLENEVYADRRHHVAPDGETVVLDLDGDEDLRRRYASVQRTRVRAAEKSGLEARELGPYALRQIARLGRGNADALGAGADEGVVEELVAGLGGDMRFFGVVRRDELVAGGVFLLHGDRVHCHLAGGGGREGRPGLALLVHGVAEWGRERGFRWLHLGPAGGAASVSSTRRALYVGTRVHDRRTYDQLSRRWLRQHGGAQPAHFPLYRAP